MQPRFCWKHNLASGDQYDTRLAVEGHQMGYKVTSNSRITKGFEGLPNWVGIGMLIGPNKGWVGEWVGVL